MGGQAAYTVIAQPRVTLPATTLVAMGKKQEPTPPPQDTPAPKTPHDAISDAVLAHIKEVFHDAALVAGWVVVAEFINTEGDADLAAFATDGLPYWRINGMLDAAPLEMGYVSEDEDFD